MATGNLPYYSKNQEDIYRQETDSKILAIGTGVDEPLYPNVVNTTFAGVKVDDTPTYEAPSVNGIYRPQLIAEGDPDVTYNFDDGAGGAFPIVVSASNFVGKTPLIFKKGDFYQKNYKSDTVPEDVIRSADTTDDINTDGVANSKAVRDAFTFERVSDQLFDKTDYRENVRMQSDGSFLEDIGSSVTQDIPIPAGETQISWLGIGGGETENYRVAWFNASGTNVLTNLTSSSSATIPIPAGAQGGSGYFRFHFKRPDDPASVYNTFMLNFGNALVYQAYEKRITKFNGINFKGGELQPEVSQLSLKYNDTDATTTGTNLFKAFTVLPNVDGDGDTIGCTGLSYNDKTKEYVVSYYSYEKESKLWFFKRNDLVDYSETGTITPVPSREIDVSAYMFHIQGNVYDPILDAYWVLGTDKDYATNGGTATNRLLILVDDEGNLIEEHLLSAYNFQAGMIALSPDYSNLLIKPNDRTWLLEINKVSKTQIRQVAGLNANEGLAVDHENSLVWIGGDNGDLKKYDYASMTEQDLYYFETLPNGDSGNVEGMIIDPIDGALIISADTYLHGANNNGNALFVFDFENKINKSIQFPDMFSFGTQNGILEGSQTWESPVFDAGSTITLNISDIIVASKNASILKSVRGIDTPPNVVEVNRNNWRDKPYYSGWGSTSPSSYGSEVTARYFQIKLNI